VPVYPLNPGYIDSFPLQILLQVSLHPLHIALDRLLGLDFQDQVHSPLEVQTEVDLILGKNLTQEPGHLTDHRGSQIDKGYYRDEEDQQKLPFEVSPHRYSPGATKETKVIEPWLYYHLSVSCFEEIPCPYIL